MTTCWCGAPVSGLHKHFCPVARREPELEYAIKGTTRKLREAEAAIQRVRELADTWLSDGAAWGPHSARCILDALDGDA